MIPVAQSKLYHPDALHLGNCLQACVASVLDLPLWMVPAFDDLRRGVSMQEGVDLWARRMFGLQYIRTIGHEIDRLPAFYIVSGPSPRGGGIYHAVVYSHGELVHDPHPSGAGVVSVDSTYHFAPVAS